jgi:hypothetical protein
MLSGSLVPPLWQPGLGRLRGALKLVAEPPISSSQTDIQPLMTIDTVANYATYVWVTAFAAFFVLAVAVGIVQRTSKRELWNNTSALPVLMLLWIAAASGIGGYTIAGRFDSEIVVPVFLFFSAAFLLRLIRLAEKPK